VPHLKNIKQQLERSMMLVTALVPTVGYDKAAAIAHLAMEDDLSLKAAAMQLGYISEADFDKIIDPTKMIYPL
jgi:fumarate hydratase class II